MDVHEEDSASNGADKNSIITRTESIPEVTRGLEILASAAEVVEQANRIPPNYEPLRRLRQLYPDMFLDYMKFFPKFAKEDQLRRDSAILMVSKRVANEQRSQKPDVLEDPNLWLQRIHLEVERRMKRAEAPKRLASNPLNICLRVTVEAVVINVRVRAKDGVKKTGQTDGGTPKYEEQRPLGLKEAWMPVLNLLGLTPGQKITSISRTKASWEDYAVTVLQKVESLDLETLYNICLVLVPTVAPKNQTCRSILSRSSRVINVDEHNVPLEDIHGNKKMPKKTLDGNNNMVLPRTFWRIATDAEIQRESDRPRRKKVEEHQVEGRGRNRRRADQVESESADDIDSGDEEDSEPPTKKLRSKLSTSAMV